MPVRQVKYEVPRTGGGCDWRVKPDPDKIHAIIKMKSSTSVPELCRFLGMVNQMTKFSPQMADKTKPLRDLLCQRISGPGTAVKKECSKR